MPTIALKLKRYNIEKEDDGWGGNGVDLYFGHIVQSELGNSAGVSPTQGGLKKGNSKEKTFDDLLCTVAVSPGKSALVNLFMYEDDETKDKVANSFGKLEIPTLGDYYTSPQQIVLWTIQCMTSQGAIRTYVDILTSAYKGKKFNTDDAYGRWSIILSATESGVTYQITSAIGGCSRLRGQSSGSLPATLFPAFVDGENDITSFIEATLV